jgi:hypothetical protein
MMPAVSSAFYFLGEGASKMKYTILRYYSVPLVLLVVLLALFPIIPSCGGGGGGTPPIVYSNATLTGVWMMKMTSPDIVNSSFKFDGNGNMIEEYELNPGTLPAPYNVASSGSYTFNLPFSSGPDAVVSGMLTSSTEGLIGDGNTFAGTLKKVTDLGLCKGTWAGTLAGAFTNSFTFTVDNTGTITSGSVFAPPLSGKLFCISGDATGLLTTGESSPLNRIKFFTGTVVTGATVTISGNYETNSGNGTYTLVK